MIDIGRNHGAATRDFAANEFGRDLGGNRRTEGLPRMLTPHQISQLLAVGTRGFQALDIFFAVQVFADGDVFHLGRDDASARVVHLRDVFAGERAAWLTVQIKTQLGQLGVI